MKDRKFDPFVPTMDFQGLLSCKCDDVQEERLSVHKVTVKFDKGCSNVFGKMLEPVLLFQLFFCI